MLRKQIHIETKNWFGPFRDYPICGAYKMFDR